MTQLDHAELLVTRARTGDSRRRRPARIRAVDRGGARHADRRGGEPGASPPILSPRRCRALATTRSGPFVGREVERDRLGAAVRAAASGTPRVALVAGEPGIGKTRLIAEAATAHAAGSTVLYGRCDEELGMPFQPFVEALRFFAEHHPVPAVRAARPLSG